MELEGHLGGGGEHTIQYKDDVLQNYTSEPYIYNFINQCHLSKFNLKNSLDPGLAPFSL